MKLSNRYQEALVETFRLFGQMERKNADRTPFMAHLMSVSSLVLEHGGSEDEAIAALLHDAIEDAGGKQREEAIKAQFGERVAEIVRGVSDTDQTPKPAWRVRKQAYLDHLDEADEGMLRVSCADKVHNVRCLIEDYVLYGEEVWKVFSAPKQDQLWVYEAYTQKMENNFSGALVQMLRFEMNRLHQMANPSVVKQNLAKSKASDQRLKASGEGIVEALENLGENSKQG